jgi:hypothetical protein
MTAKRTARTIAPPTPPTTPPMIDFVDELRPPPLEEPLSAREVDCVEPVVVLAYVLAKVLPFSVTTVVTITTVGLWEGAVVMLDWGGVVVLDSGVEEEALECWDVEACEVLWVVGVGVVDTETDVAVVKSDVVDATVCAGDELIDEIEDTFSFDVRELRPSADESLPSNAFSTPWAPTSVMTASKESNIREACVRASMVSKVLWPQPQVLFCRIQGCHKRKNRKKGAS